jgi:hypothetical protein
LERRYEQLRTSTPENERLRELTMRSIEGTINQFKEEIARYNAHRHESTPAVEAAPSNGGHRSRMLQNERELENTKNKLRMLEQSYQALENEDTDDDDLHQAARGSLMRLINQLKEEIVRYRAHHHAAGS